MSEKNNEGSNYEQELRTDLDDMTRDKPKGMALHTKIIIGLLIGAGSGLAVNFIVGGESADVKWVVENFTRPIGQLFLNLLLMIVIPLIFSSLVIGIAGIGDFRKLGRIGLKTLAYTIVFSAISVVIGLGLANAIKPGERVNPEIKEKLIKEFGGEGQKRVEDQLESAESSKNSTPLMSAVDALVPKNIFASITSTSPNLLHVMFFAVFIGISITLLPTQASAPFIGVMDALFEITTKIIDIVMKFAPYAVACLLFNNISMFGLELLQSLGWFVLTVLLGLSLHMFGVFSLSVAVLSRLNPLEFFRRIKTVILTAFSTSSSNATLPTTLRVSEENLKVPKEINSFVCTVGATMNQNGTALYEGVTVLFLAQLAGADLSLSVQLTVVYFAILGGVGAAGVPSGSIPFIIGILVYLDLDPALIAIILGVDRILDMCRTTLNVTGDLCTATYVARSEGFPLYDSKKVT
jgi:DAACS family dicarboxylate/amino acid:cation (Na+ or H+) symporter